MTYGKSMHDWEAREDERRERIWLNDLEIAINSRDKSRFTELAKKGLINQYNFPCFPLGSWTREEVERLKKAGY
ncbi:unknown [Clostridium sp. CAG:273]|nr:unknown [Clostridium sp. CAG:273]